METDLKCCYNLTCQRYRIGTTGNFCQKCGQQMRSFVNMIDYGPRVGDIEQPPANYNRRQRRAMKKARGRMIGSEYLPGYEYVGDEYLSRDDHGTVSISDKPNGHGAAKSLPAAKDWTCDAGQVNGCPIAKAPDVHIPIAMYDEWQMLADTFDTEWIAYLMGHQSEDGTWVIDDYYFPKQVANGGHCNVVEGVEGKDECLPGTIGSVHSHVRMGAFFSGEDVAHFNHPVELVINAKGEIKANVAIKLQCGHPSRSDAKVFTLGEQPPKVEHPKVVELRGKLTEQKYTAITTSTSSPKSSNWDAGTAETKYVRET